MSKISFGENLQKLRKEKNISQETLAEELQVSRQTIGKWENGTTYPETEYLIQLSDFFGVSIDMLLKGAVSETNTTEQGSFSIAFSQQEVKIESAARMQRNRHIRFVIAVVLFLISPFYPGEAGAQSINGFFMFLSIAVGIGLLIYNHLSKKQEDNAS